MEHRHCKTTPTHGRDLNRNDRHHETICRRGSGHGGHATPNIYGTSVAMMFLGFFPRPDTIPSFTSDPRQVDMFLDTSFAFARKQPMAIFRGRVSGKMMILLFTALFFLVFISMNVAPAPFDNDLAVPVHQSDQEQPLATPTHLDDAEPAPAEQSPAPPVLYVNGLYGPTLTLTDAESKVVASRVQHRTVPGGCPNKYLFVNTHTYGRHHNQLQEMMHLAAWAERLGRTAVLGWFRFSRRWVPAQDFYNFSRIMESYCLITPEEMVQRISRDDRGAMPSSPSVACLGQKFDDTPLKRLLRGPAKMKCRLDPSIPAHYNTRHGMRITKEYVASHVTKAQDTLVVLSGELAFFLRPGLAEMAALFGLLEPARHVRDAIDVFKRKHFGTDPLPQYFGIHLRRREQECLKEISESREDGGELLRSMDDNAWKIVSTQCAITVDHVKTLMASLQLLIDHQPMFLGSDHQDMTVEKALVDRGAVMYPDDGGLLGLSVDFFMLGEGKYFTGNQLSSITQNVCYRRLGRGQGCHGFIPSFTRYHSRNVETGKAYIRPFGVVDPDV